MEELACEAQKGRGQQIRVPMKLEEVQETLPDHSISSPASCWHSFKNGAP